MYMATASNIERETTTTTTTTASPICDESNDGSTVYIHVEPSSFRAVVQKLTGAPNNFTHNHLPFSSLPPAKRPKLKERRRGTTPARLDIPFATGLQFLSQIQMPIGDLSLSPVSTMDYAIFLTSNSPLSSSSPSPPSFAKSVGPTVVLTKEEEEREEKAIAQKGFYLHHSPTGGENGSKPKLLPLFPVISLKAMGLSSSRS